MDLADQHTILRHPWRPPNRVRLPLLHPYHAAKCSVQASFGTLGQSLEGGHAVGDDIGAVAPGFQHLGEQSGHLGLIVHDEDPAARYPW